MYKDFVKLIQKDEHLTDTQLKLKGELTFENDKLVRGGSLDGQLNNKISYDEVHYFYICTRKNPQVLCSQVRHELFVHFKANET